MAIVTFLCLGLLLPQRAADEGFANYLIILTSNSSTMKECNEALDGIHRLGKLSDSRVTRFYQNYLRTGGEYSRDLISEICSPRHFAKPNFALVIDLIKREPSRIRQLLPFAYAVRSEWWHDQEVKATLMTAFKTQYRNVEQLDPRFLAADGADGARLRRWIEMSYCLAYMGSSRQEKMWMNCLDDKRELSDVSKSAHLTGNWIPGRVCDHSFILVCIQHEVSYNKILMRYTSNDLLRYGTQYFKEANSAAFDAAIKDFENVARRYF